jgi:hypothetical protein
MSPRWEEARCCSSVPFDRNGENGKKGQQLISLIQQWLAVTIACSWALEIASIGHGTNHPISYSESGQTIHHGINHNVRHITTITCVEGGWSRPDSVYHYVSEVETAGGW